jgi:hypothetical protein
MRTQLGDVIAEMQTIIDEAGISIQPFNEPMALGPVSIIQTWRDALTAALAAPPPQAQTEPTWWDKCRERGHDTAILDLSHRGGRYVGVVEYFCSNCGRGETRGLAGADPAPPQETRE